MNGRLTLNRVQLIATFADSTVSSTSYPGTGTYYGNITISTNKLIVTKISDTCTGV
jgi:hypothetical protein